MSRTPIRGRRRDSGRWEETHNRNRPYRVIPSNTLTRQSCFSCRSNCQDLIPEYGHMILRDFWDGANKSKVDGARVKESGTDPARTRREGGVGDVPFLEGSGWWRVRPPSVKLREVLRDERLCTSYTSYKRYRDMWNPRRSRLAITGKFRM